METAAAAPFSTDLFLNLNADNGMDFSFGAGDGHLDDDEALPRLTEEEFNALFGNASPASSSAHLSDGTDGPPRQDEPFVPGDSAVRGVMPGGGDAARLARLVRLGKRRDKGRLQQPPAPAAAAAPVEAPLAAALAPPPIPGELETLRERVAERDRELRSATLRIAFLNKQHSQLTLKVEALEARTAALETENRRLRQLSAHNASLFVDGLGI